MKLVVFAILGVSFSTVVTATERRCTTNGNKCLQVEELHNHAETLNKMRVKYEFRPLKNKNQTQEIWVVPHGEAPTKENMMMSKRIIRQKSNVLFPMDLMLESMPNTDGGFVDIYLSARGKVIKAKNTMITVGVWRTTRPPTLAPTGTPGTSVQLDDVFFKSLALNGEPGRSITVPNDGADYYEAALTGQMTGRCREACPNCMKAVKLGLYDPNGKLVREECVKEHLGSDCTFRDIDVKSYVIDLNMAGDWEVRVSGLWARCSDGLTNFGVLSTITVLEKPDVPFQIGDAKFKEFRMNGNRVRTMVVKKGEPGEFDLTGYMTGQCTNGCPGCIKATRLTLFDPENNPVETSCSEHTGSDCVFGDLLLKGVAVDTDIVGDWTVKVQSSWASCSQGLNMQGILATVSVIDTSVTLKDVSFKDIALNDKPGRQLTLTDESTFIKITGSNTGRCGTGCPGCVKAVKLAMFDPNNNRISDHCIAQHMGSDCTFDALSLEFPINTDITGEWQIRVEGRWAWCKDGLDPFGVLGYINV